MTDIYAGEQGAIDTRVKRQLEEENRYKLAEQMRVRDEAAKAKEILTRRANEAQQEQQQQPQGFVAQMPTPNVPGDLVPQGMIPQEGLTGFGGMSTPQEGPTGLQPQGDATGLGGMQPTGWSETQPQEQTPAKGTLYSTLDNAETTYTQAQARVDQVKQTANELRRAGLHDQADAYETKTYALQKAADDAKKAHLEVAEKAVEYVGSQANGYLNAIEDPTTNPEAAWQRMKLRLQMDGLDTEELDAVPVNQRKAYAEQARDASVSSKDQIALEKALLVEQKRDARFKETQALREKLAADRLRRDARKEAGVQARWEAGQDQKAYKNAESILTKNISAAQSDRREVDSQIKDLNFKITGIRSGTIITEEFGKKYSQEARQAELTTLQDRLGDLNTNREELSTEINTHEEHLKTLADSFKKDGGKPTKPVTLDKTVQSQLVAAINAHPDQLATIKSNFSELYPGLKFEDYVKVNVNSKAFKKTN